MEFWEFLLQKEGDHTWLPLEAAKVEILEGRYRVMAHSSHANEPVEICVSQMLLDETPPKRRLLKRTGHTNQEGLMVVMPFTRLQPGDWELQCRHKQDWRYSVQLQVLSQEDETSGEWHPNWEDTNEENIADNIPESVKGGGDTSDLNSNPPPYRPADELGDFPKPKAAAISAAESATAEAVNLNPQRSPSRSRQETASHETVTKAINLADQLSRQIVDSIFKDIEQSLTDSASDSAAQPAAPTPSDNIASATIPPCLIDLSQSAFMAQQGRPLTVTGQIVPAPDSANAEARLPASELRVQLRNPNNSEILLAQTIPFQSTELPAAFRFDLELPTPLPTRLILGEIALFLDQPVAAPTVWACQSFTITAPIHDLLEAIANEAEGQHDQGYVPVSSETEPSSDDELQAEDTENVIPNDFALPSLNGAKSVFQPLSKHPLPPQLHSSAPDPTDERLLSLPNFPSLSLPPTADPGQSAAAAPPVDESPVAEGNGVETPPSLESPLADPLDAIIEPDALDDNTLDKQDSRQQQDVETLSGPQTENTGLDPLDAELAAATIQAMGEEADTSNRVTLPTVDIAFQALNLQERFWSRLSALTIEAYETAAEYKSAVEAAGVSTAAVEAGEQAVDGALHQVLPQGGQTVLNPHLAEEIVVYEEPIAAAPVDTALSSSIANSVEEAVEPANSRDDSENVTPPPGLKIPDVELIAGEMISIEISLPAQESRTYVKLWVSDRQTRVLLDQPRWLMDLQPNGNGELVTSLRLKTPLGCTEARFTAIAVNMVTQQESYKTVVDRTVFPPNLPTLSLDEFEM